MWKLVILFVISSFFSEKETCVIIIDECSNWKKYNHTWVVNNELVDDNLFSYEKKIWDILFVSLERIWLKEEDRLGTKKMTLNELKEMDFFFSSEISSKDWKMFLDQQKHKKFYLVTPEEYCSEKRFAFQYQFTLYEVKISIPIEE